MIIQYALSSDLHLSISEPCRSLAYSLEPGSVSIIHVIYLFCDKLNFIHD
jgi:hypothetical protein